MGIIKQQTLKGTFFSYIGVFIGFVTNTFILTKVLDTDQVGLINILTSFSLIFAQFAILGFNATARYFPYFRNEKNKHNGYLFLACAISLIGFILFVIGAYAFKEVIISQKSQDNNLFRDYYWYLLPLTFANLYFNIFDLYSRLLYDAAAGRLIREFTLKLLILVCVVLLIFRILDFRSFMWLWLSANLMPMLLMMIRLVRKGNFSLKPNFNFLNKDVQRNLFNLCLFGILTGASPLLVDNIDRYMVNSYFGLADTGIYSIAASFGIIIALPTRSLYSIAYTVIAESWIRKDMANIHTVYRKSCINQSIVALFLFILVWANIHNALKVLPPDYADGVYIVFFIGLANLFDALTGVNAVILATSRYYRYDSFFYLALVGVTIGSNLFFIPKFGITGAAMATALTMFIFNLSRYLFILFKFKLQPFTVHNLLVIVLGVLIYWLSTLIPVQQNLYLDTFIRGGFITLLYAGSVYFLRLSSDINDMVADLLAKLKRS
ncbi:MULTISPECIES: lipopolysaccharide biosynthesis protein [Olivibacter]|jgi:O-antigen/teichoic acid export membrane protein|uniref:Lipopolysaccharide biosynthesis protein n=1 Tax=Olivibacter jilunii TaxID=985016 RepID=A0ABW6BAN9_9SPHI|nr:oligosaccharide flippase family protein [Olivibacter sp. UJ_SKK_5.1]MDX3912484.1 oligosaccharide flippase family protein [Pseudosphingobacterium sp.]